MGGTHRRDGTHRGVALTSCRRDSLSVVGNGNVVPLLYEQCWTSDKVKHSSFIIRIHRLPNCASLATHFPAK